MVALDYMSVYIVCISIALIGAIASIQLGRIYYIYTDLRPWFDGLQPWKTIQYFLPFGLSILILYTVVLRFQNIFVTLATFPIIVILFAAQKSGMRHIRRYIVRQHIQESE